MFPYLLLIIGMIYSLSFLAQIWSGSLLSVDSGLKYLMVRQYSEGDFSLAIHSSHPDWVQDLWKQGFFPIRPPFVVRKGAEYIVVFPPLFQVLSVPGFVAIGEGGLFIIPMLALWVLWLRFIALCRGLQISPFVSSLFLAILIFASPLTVYGVEFWEHTLGALLVFVCFEYAVLPKIGGASRVRVVLYGALAGLSVWIRPESFILLVPLIFYIGFFHPRQKWLFIGITLLFVLGYFSFNLLVSGVPFGFHGRQVIEADALGSLSSYYVVRFLPMLKRLSTTFPLIFVFLPAIPTGWFVLKRRDLVLLSALFTAFFLGSPLLFPNSGGGQWGPRYFLSALAPVTLLMTIFMDALFRKSHSLFKSVFVGLTVIAFLFGSLINYGGIREYLYTVHYLRADALARYLKESAVRNVITSCRFIPMEVAQLHQEKNFFFSEDLLAHGRPLLEEFSKRGVSSFFLVTPRDGLHLPSQIKLRNGTTMKLSYHRIPVVSLYQLTLVTWGSEGG